ncbi:phosphoglycolate phosphatase [Pseudoxanthomonas suwonensis]|uniref:phosphoglycolate phosphatase n=1 Tax=Pseudoxanthomonas suwonensis TaxID=314722 RepID=UPI000466135B|nr:phosphoglycolate phosphatase [Pseudoxanthomonas suwonensis]
MATKAVLFDLDGTLVDSASDIAEALNRTLESLGYPRVPETTVRGWIGEGVRQLVATALRHAGDERAPEAVMDGFMVHYRQCLLRSPVLYPGVAEGLELLRERGLPMAVCTNKPQAMVEPLLGHLGIAGFFRAFAGGDTLPQRKPDPAPLLHLAGLLGVEAGDCLMVGDSATDRDAAVAAGMPVALVRYGYPRGMDLENAGAVAVLDDLRQLQSLL